MDLSWRPYWFLSLQNLNETKGTLFQTIRNENKPQVKNKKLVCDKTLNL